MVYFNTNFKLLAAILSLAAVCAGFTLHRADAQPQTNRPNVLFIVADDLSTSLSVYGEAIARSPNLERLAKRGVKFDRAYCQYPLCSPSRTSFLSGRRPETTRILNNTTDPRTRLKDVAMLPEHFKQHGYFTARIGKIAHDTYENIVAWDVSEKAEPSPYFIPDDDAAEVPDNTRQLVTARTRIGDHGFHLGEHGGLWRKLTLFEECARAPLIVVAPKKGAGAVSSRLVEFVDIYPTLAELCGLPAPAGVEGLSFAPLLDNPNQPWKKAAFTTLARRNLMGRSVRTERYRYTEWGDEKTAELYDHQTDPREYTNLVNDPKHASALAEMRKTLKDGWRAAIPVR
jgi:arylsulfatase A-like enzyme